MARQPKRPPAPNYAVLARSAARKRPPHATYVIPTPEAAASLLLDLCGGDPAAAHAKLSKIIGHERDAPRWRKLTGQAVLLSMAFDELRDADREIDDNEALRRVARRAIAPGADASVKRQSLVRLLQRKLGGRTLVAFGGLDKNPGSRSR
jgi:hypothetical protein